jgi:nitrite reductase/ring-hydroxylating ferredoxin subunit/uncharacterized membrane protein
VREIEFLKQILRLESAKGLDPLVGKADKLFSKVLASRELRDVLHGVPIGHPLHPVAVQVPIGAFTSTLILDLLPDAVLPGGRRASTLFTGIGIASALPSILAGWADWLHLHEQQKRVGIVHAATNATAISFYTLSFIQRLRGKPASAKLLGFTGYAIISVGGYLGGHLSYRQAAGANHTEDVPHLFPQGWQTLGPLNELLDNELSRMDVAGQPLLVLRQGNTVRVLSNTCSHLSGPLDEGVLEGAHTDDPCVSCPWHKSVFSLTTGEVVHGPATAPQPVFETRVTDGLVEVLLPDAG